MKAEGFRVEGQVGLEVLHLGFREWCLGNRAKMGVWLWARDLGLGG